ncbi:4'-phosphopantetheinyl transferase family protein [Streptomyces sp. NPDC015171]|uniref:4'-phosphopantetheinyl transferase family protein n=1 Tax=Streptomyces sp. NPDC015171 TaxID=3364945 RepID=UPI0036FB5B71
MSGRAHGPARASAPAWHEVHLWHFSLDVAADGFAGVLSPEEEARRDRLADVRHRNRFTVAHGVKRRILGPYLSTPPRRVPIETGRWGKPRVAGDEVTFSLSHAGGAALLAVSRGRDVGVDIERPRPGLDPPRFAARYFRPEESRQVASAAPALRWASFLALWTRKEASVKAVGARLGQALSLPVGRGACAVCVPAGPTAAQCRVDDIAVRPGHAGAVALVGPGPFRVVSRTWDAAGAVDGTAAAVTEVPISFR